MEDAKALCDAPTDIMREHVRFVQSPEVEQREKNRYLTGHGRVNGGVSRSLGKAETQQVVDVDAVAAFV